MTSSPRPDLVPTSSRTRSAAPLDLVSSSPSIGDEVEDADSASVDNLTSSPILEGL